MPTSKTGAENVRWDLSDLYQSIDDSQIGQDIKKIKGKSVKIAEKYKRKISKLKPQKIKSLLVDYEQVLDLMGKITTYSYLHWSTNTEDTKRGAFFQKIIELSTYINQELLFIKLELAHVSKEQEDIILSSPGLKEYKHWLRIGLKFKPHLLSEPEERILSEKSLTSNFAWTRFFSEIHSAKRYKLDNDYIGQETILKYLYNPNRKLRSLAQETFTTGLDELKRISTYIFNCILADKSSNDKLRRYPTWLASRNLDNQVEAETVNALINSVTSRYDIVARYYSLKKKLLGLKELYDYDRYAPLLKSEQYYPWEEAKKMVQEAYRNFYPPMGEIADKFFKNNWIDAAVTPGKRSGAYSHSAVPSVHPYIFLNYLGTPRDVMTLAHELGHGIHQYLSRKQGILQADTPLTTAETASVFGEMLAFKALFQKTTDKKEKLALLTGKIEDSLATVFRQVAMHRFEDTIHTARREKGELSTEQLNDFWISTQNENFKGSVILTDNYKLWWSYIPHFIHSPGYVYAYAFGELLVLALHSGYEERKEDFPPLYFKLLSAGGSNWPHKLIKPFGINLKDPKFWYKGLELLERLVLEAEQLAE